MSDDTLAFNGINGDNGGYLSPGLTAQQLAAVAQGKNPDEEIARELNARRDQGGKSYRVNADTRDLAQTGWGVIFAHGADPALKAALAPLLAWRQEQAGARFKEFSGGKGFRPKDSKNSFLERAGVGPGSVNPDVVPYYLLIVGDPEAIPYRFQYQLDVQYAVGRLHFERIEDYAQYAQSVVAAERGTIRRPRQAAFFGVRNPDDRATQLSADKLILPLAERLASSQDAWQTQLLVGEEQASKARLANLLGKETPALLLAASHGMVFERTSPRQHAHQGALLCQDWPGPLRHQGPIPEEFYFSADDLGDDADVAGLVAFCFACYGAGTPRLDEFAFSAGKRQAVANEAFLARLPQRLLSHPGGSALAVVGHVERAWGYSFMWGRGGPQHQVFLDALAYLLADQPVGAAMDWFNERYAELSTLLSQELEEIEYNGKVAEDEQLAMLWTANSDARNYVVLGDPAVRLAVAQPAQPADARLVLQSTSQPSNGQHLADAPSPAPQTSFAPANGAATLLEAAPQPALPSALTSVVVEAAPQSALPELKTKLAAGQAQELLRATLLALAEQLGSLAEQVARGSASLEVVTYGSDAVAALSYDPATGQLGGSATPRALTRISPAGHTIICVPERNGSIDSALWQIHQEQVAQAQARQSAALSQTLALLRETLEALERVSERPGAVS